MTEDREHPDGLRPPDQVAPDPASPNPFAPRVPTAAPPGAASRSMPAITYALLMAGVFAIVFGLFIVLRRPPPPPPAATYDEQTRTLFLGACAIDGSPSTRSVCECAYEDIVAKVPYERFRELDAAAIGRRSTTSTTRPPAGTGTIGRTASTVASPLPDDVRAIFATCVGKQIIATPNPTAPPSTKAPTSVAPTTPVVPTTTTAPSPSLTVS